MSAHSRLPSAGKGWHQGSKLLAASMPAMGRRHAAGPLSSPAIIAQDTGEASNRRLSPAWSTASWPRSSGDLHGSRGSGTEGQRLRPPQRQAYRSDTATEGGSGAASLPAAAPRSSLASAPVAVAVAAGTATAAAPSQKGFQHQRRDESHSRHPPPTPQTRVMNTAKRRKELDVALMARIKACGNPADLVALLSPLLLPTSSTRTSSTTSAVSPASVGHLLSEGGRPISPLPDISPHLGSTLNHMHTAAALTHLSQLLSKGRPSDINALMSAPTCAGGEGLPGVVLQLCVVMGTQVEKCEARQVANAAWAISKLHGLAWPQGGAAQHSNVKASMANLMGQLVCRSRAVWSGLNAQEASNLIYAVAQMKDSMGHGRLSPPWFVTGLSSSDSSQPSPASAVWIREWISLSEPLIPSMSPQAVSNCCWALAQLTLSEGEAYGGRDPVPTAAAAAAAEVSDERVSDGSGGSEVNRAGSVGSSGSADGSSAQTTDAETASAVRRWFAVACAHTAPLLASYPGRALAVMSWAMAKLKVGHAVHILRNLVIHAPWLGSSLGAPQT